MERTASCPSCGRGVFDEDAFCSWCGASIQARTTDTGRSRLTLARRTIPTGARQTCGSCNNPVLPGDVFCSTCGARSGQDPEEPRLSESWTTIPQRITESSRGKYTLIRQLGRGGMGIVFMARDEELGRLVAIKVLSPSLLADEAMVKRFQREARTIASLRHRSIVSVYDVGRTGDLHYFVMDFIEGVSLSDILRTFGPLPIPVIQAILYQVGSALAYAHRPGREIVHRDVKPSNIMLDPEGQAVVMDFGISKVGETSSGLTRTGLVIGTPEYMSPEQCRGHMVTRDSDQYSLGAVLFATLTGAPPFTGPFYQVLMAHQTETVPSIQELRPDCPPELAESVERMLAKSPGDRWPGIQDAIGALGLRPLGTDDPVLRQIGELVEGTIRGQASRGSGEEARGRGGGDGDRTPTSLKIVPIPEGLEIGDEVGLRALALFSDGVEETGLHVTWESTDPSIAIVDTDTGRLRAVGEGSAVIQALGSGIRESVAIRVAPPRVMRVAIEPEQVEVEVGGSARLQARPCNKRDDPLQRPVTWSSSDPRTASVSEDGTVVGKAEGTASILAHCEGVGAATAVRVVPATSPTEAVPEGAGEVARIDVSSPPGRLHAGQTFHLVATPLDEGGAPLERAIHWTVEHPSVLREVGPGRFRALRAGSGTLLAESGNTRTRVHVTVVEDEPSELAPTTARPSSSPPTLEPPDDRRSSVGSALSAGTRRFWVPVASAVAAIALAAGLWLGGGLLDGGPPPVWGVNLRTSGGESLLSPLELTAGDSLVLVASLVDADGEPLSGRSVSWRSSDETVAEVTPAGLVVALAAGTAGIAAVSEGAVGEAEIRVRSGATAIVIRRAADQEPAPESLSLEVGESVDLDAAVVDPEGEPVPESDIQWTASPASVATVDPNGVVVAVAAGEGALDVTSEGLRTGLRLLVEAPPPAPTAAGTVVVRIVPTWAYVLIDGVRRGDGAQTHELSLTPGRYRLRLENPIMTPLDTTFTVAAGATTELRLRLSEREGA